MSERRSYGRFISFEGIDGSGKTTQAKLLAAALHEQGIELVALREPGGTAISEAIRAIVLDKNNSEMSINCELLLLEASRSQLVEELIKPTLERGIWVVCDRFYDSTFAYQAGGRGMDKALVRELNRIGSGGLVPDMTFWLDIDVDEAYARATKTSADRLESAGLEFQRRVAAAYQDIYENDNQDGHIIKIDASGSEQNIHQDILNRALSQAKGLV